MSECLRAANRLLDFMDSAGQFAAPDRAFERLQQLAIQQN
jgi:hypothetical protein